ncbi:AAA family ATPase [Halorubrum vacuolatum]|uniref:AAA ATPase domain-containing protein n=1 Tax=Halorubrum vacuolatum TaxID=63740 RepID=A0A238WS90_HALVU|nr:AAA family ATPase [Halorubrum vacuolatum]SNR49183.1 AAA ATPase domain-containing protein [Halorubrum vacuolatum]
MQKIEIQRFGPIKQAEIDVSPLTVLIGPNGSGKSYTAKLLHSYYRSYGDVLFRRVTQKTKKEELLSEDQYDAYEEALQELQNGNEAHVDPSIINAIAEFVYQEMSEKLDRGITSTFSSEAHDLITEGRRKTRFDISTEFGGTEISFWREDENIQTRQFPEINDRVVLVPEGGGFEEVATGTKKEDRGYLFEVPEDALADIDLTTILAVLTLSEIGIGIRTDSRYLPAARSGLLESHKVISQGAFDMLSHAGIEPIEVPAFSGEVKDYLNQIVNMSNKDEGELSDIADDYEQDLLDGEIKIEQKDDRPYPEIKFLQLGREFPLHLISTGVLETAPLILYTRYLLSSDSTLVIEEPEAHLHPENQLKVAHFIVRLSNAGVRVIVTTHSDFFLQQLSHSIRLSQVNEKSRMIAN